MPKTRGRSHTTLTETAAVVVGVLKRHPNVKMIAPGEITNTGRAGASSKYLTIIHTAAGFELLITGQGTQKVAVHTDGQTRPIIDYLTQHKRLREFMVKERVRKPGI